MTTEVLLNFDGGLVEEAQGRSINLFNGPVVDGGSANFGSQGLRLVNSNSYLELSGVFTLDDFTMETWFLRPSGSVLRSLVGSPGNSQNFLEVSTTGLLRTWYGTGGSVRTGATVVQPDVYHHAALSKLGSTARLFLNGYLEAQYEVASSFSVQIRLGFVTGADVSGVRMDGVRIIRGAALYTQNFTPPTTAPTVAYSTLREYNLAAQLGVGELMPLNPATTLPNQPVVFRFDPQLGTATLTGTVKNIGSPNQPVARRVILIEEQSGRVIRETFSNATTGVYTFSELLPQARYTVIAYDHTGVFSAVIADNLEATL